MKQGRAYGARFFLVGSLLAGSGSAMGQVVPVFQEQGANRAPIVISSPIGVVRTGGAIFGIEGNLEVVKGHPYQAEAQTEIKQTLMDGSHIDQTSTAEVARDSQGRTVRMQKLNTLGPWGSDASTSPGEGPTLVSIFDPVSKEHINYLSDAKIAHVTALPTLGKVGGVLTASAAPGMSTDGAGPAVAMTFSVQGHGDFGQGETGPKMMSGGLNTRTESLGGRTIEGVSAEGTRTTTTIPEGAIGNERDIVVTRETWYAPELRVVLNSTQNDPRFGKTSYSLSNIVRKEPDKGLFRIPADYKMDKVPVPPLPFGPQNSPPRP